MNVEQYVLEIQETLRQQNYYGRKINYTEMQELHQTYGSLLPEKEFALYVLEIRGPCRTFNRLFRVARITQNICSTNTRRHICKRYFGNIETFIL